MMDFFEACKNKNLARVQELINQDHDNIKELFRGITALHYSSINGDIELLKLLIENGANVNEKCVSENTPLHYASKYGHIEILQELINHGARVTEINIFGLTPIYNSIYYGYVDITKKLLECYGGDICNTKLLGWTPLHYASFIGNLEIVKLIVEYQGYSIISMKDQNNQTASNITHFENIRDYLNNYQEDFLDAKNTLNED